MKKIKNLFLFVFLISISILLSTHLTLFLENNVYYVGDNINLFTRPYYYLESIEDDDKIERNYFKSNWFSETIVKYILTQLNYSVANPDKYNDSLEYSHGEDGGKTEREALKDQKDLSKEYLESIKSIDYFAINNVTGELFTNTKYKKFKDFEKNADGYFQIKFTDSNLDYRKIDGKEYKSSNDFKYLLDYGSIYVSENIDVYVSIHENVREDKFFYFNYVQYNRILQKYDICSKYRKPSCFVAIVSLILYIIAKFKSKPKKSSLWTYYNKIPLEIIFTILIMDIVAIILVLGSQNININQFGVIPIFILLAYIVIFMKQMSNLEKKSDFLKTSVIYRLCYRFLNSIKRFFADTREMIINSTRIDVVKKIVIIALLAIFIEIMFGLFLASAYLSFFSFVIIFGVQFVFLVYLVKRLSYLNEIMVGVEKIKDGQVDYKIVDKKDPFFSKLAEDINNIGTGLENSMEEKIKSERMKSELITNVSHDLKTPLTSIINYIQIIKKEKDIQPQYINDYINILDKKSKRLKVLIEDLFEASKASTGNIELELVKLDMKQLLRQAIGELEDRLEEQNLTLKVNLTQEDTFVLADGKSLYRIFENLLSNICKYAMENTRVYIDLSKEDENIIVTMKNISSYELNFDPEEIIERFKRADESRNTEGSGLGLAIARDLTVLQGGLLTVDIDGDLFKAKIEMKEYNGEN